MISSAVLAAIIQTPGLSHFFGCRPMGPWGWSIAISSSMLATYLPDVIEAVTKQMQETSDSDEPSIAKLLGSGIRVLEVKGRSLVGV